VREKGDGLFDEGGELQGEIGQEQGEIEDKVLKGYIGRSEEQDAERNRGLQLTSN